MLMINRALWDSLTALEKATTKGRLWQAELNKVSFTLYDGENNIIVTNDIKQAESDIRSWSTLITSQSIRLEKNIIYMFGKQTASAEKEWAKKFVVQVMEERKAERQAKWQARKEELKGAKIG